MKIAKNLGQIERLVRLLLGIAGGIWVISQSDMGGMEWLVAVISGIAWV